MKKFLSLLLVTAMLIVVFCINANAAIPVNTGGEWSILLEEDFEGTPTYFTQKRGSLNGTSYVSETGNSSNTVVDMKLGEQYTELETDAGYGKYYNNVRIGQGMEQSDNLTSDKTLSGTYMLEFDLCAINPLTNFSVGVRSARSKSTYKHVRINPNKLNKNEWYTFRILVESTDSLDIDETTTTVYKKLRDSDDAFVKLDGMTMGGPTIDIGDKDYGMRSCYSSDLVTFGFSFKESYVYPYLTGLDTTMTTTGYIVQHNEKTLASTVDTTRNCEAAKDTHYQLDNIKIYSKSEEQSFEFTQGLIKNYDMDPFTNAHSSQYLTEQAEEDGNNYVKFSTGITESEYVAGTDYFAHFPANQTLPEVFVVSFDANNASLGSALDIEVYGDGQKDENGTYVRGTFPRRSIYLRSHSGIENKWYSYKIVCHGKPNQTGEFTFEVYRKERDSDEAYTLLSGARFAGQLGNNTDVDYGIGSVMSGDKSWVNSIRIGDCRRAYLGAYSVYGGVDDAGNEIYSGEDKNQANGEWYIDNVSFSNKAAVAGNIDLMSANLSIDLNVSTSTPESVAVLAVYDGERFVNAGFAELSSSVGQTTVSAGYNVLLMSEPRAVLYVWDGLNAIQPILSEPINISPFVEHDGGELTAPLETEYSGEFKVDWSDPASYANWTITQSPDIKINEATGVLTFDISGKEGYYEVKRAPLMADNFDLEFSLKMEEYGDSAFQFRARQTGYNNYQTVHQKFLAMLDRQYANHHGTGTLVDIGNDWHDWKMEVRGKYCTIYMDGGEVCRFIQPGSSHTQLISFALNATVTNTYKIHLGSIHYKPYFPDVTLTSPANGAELTEGSSVTLQATAADGVESVDFYVNGLKVGTGTVTDGAASYPMGSMQAGTYRVSVGTGGVKSIESVVTVNSSLNTTISPASSSISYGSSVNLSFNDADVDDISKIEIYANNKYQGDAKTVTQWFIFKSFTYTLSGLPVGTNQVYARVIPKEGMPYITPTVNIDVTSGGNKSVVLDREYELNYEVTTTGEVLVNDGYFALDVTHTNSTLTAETKDGSYEKALGTGKYKIVVAAGVADLYYNGQFAASWFMPRSSSAQAVTHSGVSSFEIGGTGVKTRLFNEEWSGESDYSTKLTLREPNYSLEFDKTDASDERLIFYDGEYAIDIDIRNGEIHTNYHNLDTGEIKPVVLEGEATAGYWRINVAKGLAQVWIDNEFKGSFAAVENFRAPEIQRTMTNPSASTFIAVKRTDDMYYHTDDFSNGGELSSIDYWFEDTDAVTATVTDGALKVAGTGDVYLNANSDDVWLSWSEKVSAANSFYVTARVFRGERCSLKAGYDFTKGEWFVDQYAADYDYHKIDKHHPFSGTAPTTGKWHTFELALVENSLVLKMDGSTVIDLSSVNMPYWGVMGFGVDDGTVEIDNLSYQGRGKATAGVKSVPVTSEVGISEMFKLSDGRVVVYNNSTYHIYTDDKGETWSEPAMKSYGYMGGVENLADGKMIRMVRTSNGTDYVAQVSSDDGQTWETMGSLDSARTAQRRVLRNGTITQFSTGRIMLACDETFTEYNSITGLYYSDDLGKTWHESKTAFGGVTAEQGYTTENTGYNVQEGMFEELPDGTIRYFGRTGLGFLHYMDSTDGGENFGEFKPTRFYHSLTSFATEQDDEDPNTYYAIISYDANTYNYRTLHAPRNRLALFVSHDGMENWEFAMDLVETGDIPVWDSCNHVIKVFDGTIYINWNNLNGDRLSFVFAIDKTKLRTSKRLAEVHERQFVGYMGNSNFDKNSVLPKTTGKGYIYGNLLDITVNGGMYDAKTISQIFGAVYKKSGSTITFTLGDATVVFTEGSSEYTANGETKTFAESCMSGGYLNIKACAEAFGKTITESDSSYVLWYDKPVTPQYQDDIEGWV